MEFNTPILASEVRVTPSDLKITYDILETLPTLEALNVKYSTPQEISSSETAITHLEQKIDVLENLSLSFKKSANFRGFSMSLANIKSAHHNLNFDRAIDMLYSGDFSDYFNLTESESNYNQNMSKVVRDVSRRVKAL